MLELVFRLLLASLWTLPPGLTHADFQLNLSGPRVPKIHCEGHFQVDNREGLEKLKMHYRHHCRPHLDEEEGLDMDMIWRLDQNQIYELDAKTKTYRAEAIDKSSALYQSLISGQLPDPLPTTRQSYYDGMILWTHGSKTLPWLWRIEDPKDHHISDVTTLAKGVNCHLSLAYSNKPVQASDFTLPSQYHPDK